MTELTASRTLVKSPPELWAECSDAASLSRHLDRFGEIRITRLEPETVVAWEGESASGTVRLEPSGWGTKVVLTAQAAEESEPERVSEAETVDLPAPVAEDPEPPVEEPEPLVEEPEPPVEEPVPAEEPVEQLPAVAEPARPGPFARLLGLFRRRRVEPESEAVAVAEAEPEPVPAPEPQPAPAAEAPEEPEADPPPAVAIELTALEQALDSLGQAHHRPFSRA
jgi:hypothetical protein